MTNATKRKPKQTIAVKCSLCGEKYNAIITAKSDIKFLTCRGCSTPYKLKEAK